MGFVNLSISDSYRTDNYSAIRKGSNVLLRFIWKTGYFVINPNPILFKTGFPKDLKYEKTIISQNPEYI